MKVTFYYKDSVGVRKFSSSARLDVHMSLLVPLLPADSVCVTTHTKQNESFLRTDEWLET
jgi:hypothetical protein